MKGEFPERIPAADLYCADGAAILAYVVLDGYDLGVGMLMRPRTSPSRR